MLKSNQKIKITIVVDKDLASWIKRQAEQENRSINNFLETLLYQKRKEKEVIACISKQ